MRSFPFHLPSSIFHLPSSAFSLWCVIWAFIKKRWPVTAISPRSPRSSNRRHRSTKPSPPSTHRLPKTLLPHSHGISRNYAHLRRRQPRRRPTIRPPSRARSSVPEMPLTRRGTHAFRSPDPSRRLGVIQGRHTASFQEMPPRPRP